MAASLVYIVFAGFLYFSYPNKVREEYLAYPPEIHSYIDFPSFSGSREGVVVIVCGAVMGIIWALYLSRHKKAV
jgi:hypothetical protein